MAESVQSKDSSAPVVDVSSTIPRAVQWVVGIGRELKEKNNKEKKTQEIEVQRG